MEERALYSPKVIQSIMQAHGLAFLKERGQNFLIDGNMVRRIVEAAEVEAGDAVLEIGPGIGSMTQELLKRAGRVIAIEVDPGFVAVLSDLFAEEIRTGQLVLLQEDVLKVDLTQVLTDYRLEGPAKIVSNLPYYISSPAIIRILESVLPIQSLTMMLQKELVDRILAQPGTRDYGALTLFVQLYGQAKPCFAVPRACFLPAPAVDSAVVRVDPLGPDEGYSLERRAQINDLVRLVFQQRRKQAAKTLAQALGRDKKELTAALRQLGLPETARPENLRLEDFQGLLEILGI